MVYVRFLLSHAATAYSALKSDSLRFAGLRVCALSLSWFATEGSLPTKSTFQEVGQTTAPLSAHGRCVVGV